MLWEKTFKKNKVFLTLTLYRPHGCSNLIQWVVSAPKSTKFVFPQGQLSQSQRINTKTFALRSIAL